MIAEADDALEALLKAADLGPGKTDLVFDAPTADWAAGRGSKRILNLWFHSVTEKVESRVGDWTDVRDENGRVVERQPPLRRYDLAYLVTAWTGDVREDHRLLSAALLAFASHESLPEQYRTGSLLNLGLPLPLHVATPVSGVVVDAWDVWGALGTPPRAHLDVVLSVPLRLPVDRDIAPEIKTRRFAIGRDDGEPEDVATPKRDEEAGARNEALLGSGGDNGAATARPRGPRPRGRRVTEGTPGA